MAGEASFLLGQPQGPCGVRLHPVLLREVGEPLAGRVLPLLLKAQCDVLWRSLEFCPYLFPEFVFTGHEVYQGGRIELPERHREYFELIRANPDIFPGFYHIDLLGNVLPKLDQLRRFGFYPDPAPNDTSAESCGAHSPAYPGPDLATRT